jgi:CheY-like chemotaxis protein
LRLVLEGVQLEAQALAELPELQPGRYARLSVEDSGHGMDGPTLKRIFEPFFTTKGAGEGSGLGLAVTLGIVREHQGALRAVSEPGNGATFSVYLPAHEWSTQEVSDDLQALPRASGERILFVDDERALCESSKLVLENIGYAVTTHDDPQLALREFTQRPQAFDLVVTDLTMPGMTGVELARSLLQIRAELPVLLASGYGGGFTVEQVRAMGLRDMLSKPLTPRALSAAVQKTLAR